MSPFRLFVVTKLLFLCIEKEIVIDNKGFGIQYFQYLRDDINCQFHQNKITICFSVALYLLICEI